MQPHDARDVTKLIFTKRVDICKAVFKAVLHFQPTHMAYLLKVFSADDVSQAERDAAEKRFRAALEAALGDESLVLPCYSLYQKLFAQHSDHPRPWPITEPELLLVEQWEAAELAATQAAFGVNRYLGDADFEIQALPSGDTALAN